jgi:hypothetical protein
LRKGNVKLWLHLPIEAPGAHIRHHAHNFVPHGIQAALGSELTASESLSDRVFSRPHRAGQSFVDDGDERGVARVLRREIAPGFE